MYDWQKKIALFIWCNLLLLVVVAQSQNADVLIRKDGAVLTGRFLERLEDGGVRFQTAEGDSLLFDTREYQSYQLGPSEENGDRWDRVTLFNGSSFEGLIVNTLQFGRVQFLLEGQNTLLFNLEDIRMLERGGAAPGEGSVSTPEKKEKTYEFRENGWYNASYFAGLNAESEDGLKLGLGVHTVAGYQWNRWIGTGVGAGLDAYSLNKGEFIVPVFAEFRGYFTRSFTAPFYSMNIGYGFAFKNENQEIIGADGGLLLHPAVGLRFGAHSNVNVIFDLGYRFQWASYQREFLFNGELETREIIYQRLALRLGLLF